MSPTWAQLLEPVTAPLARGCGSALPAAGIAHCDRGSWRQMIAVIGDSGNTASIRLHERFGFRLAGTFHAVGFKFGRWVDAVLMQRQIGPGSSTLAVD